MVKGGWGGKVTSLSSQDIQGYSGEERDVEFRGKNTSGYLRDKVTAWTKHASAYHQNPPPLPLSQWASVWDEGGIHMK